MGSAAGGGRVRAVPAVLAILAAMLLGGCGTGTPGADARDPAVDAGADAADAWLPDVLPWDGSPDDGGCAHIDCSYLDAHYAGFQPDFETCKEKFTGPSGCTTCCRSGWGGVRQAVSWCCPPDEDAGGRDAAEGDGG